jgi:tRNA-specific adenosine deaminase 2
MIGSLRGKESWTTLAFASAAFGLALYYLHTQRSVTPKDELSSQVNEEQRQGEVADHVPDAMDPEERAYHERFMREAIAMVNHTLHNLHPLISDARLLTTTLDNPQC